MRGLDVFEKSSHLFPRENGRLDLLVSRPDRLEQLPVVLEQIVVEETQPPVQNALGTALQRLVAIDNERADLRLAQHEGRTLETVDQDADLARVGLAGTPGETGQDKRVRDVALPAVRIGDIEINVGQGVDFWDGDNRLTVH